MLFFLDGLWLIDLKKSKKLDYREIFDDSIQEFSRESIQDEFNIKDAGGSIVQHATPSDSSGKAVNIDRKVKKEFFESSFNQYKHIQRVIFNLQKSFASDHYINYNEIKNRIENIVYRKSGRIISRSDLLSSILRYCKTIDRQFPSFSEVESQYQIDYTSKADYSGFGKILLDEFLNLDILYHDLQATYSDSSFAQTKIGFIHKLIEDGFNSYCSGVVTAQNLAESILAILKNFILENFPPNSQFYEYWKEVFNFEKAPVSNSASMFRITMTLEAFSRRLANLFSLIPPNDGHVLRDGRMYTVKFSNTLSAFIGGDKGKAEIISSSSDMKRLFGLHKKGTHHLSEAQLSSVDLFNEYIFDFFNILSKKLDISGEDYANAWNEANSQNNLLYKMWATEDFSGNYVSFPSWAPLHRAKLIQDGFYIPAPTSNIDAILISQGTHVRQIQFRNIDEFLGACYFTDSEIIDDINIMSLNPDGKVFDIRGNKVSISAFQTILSNISLVDRKWVAKAKRKTEGSTKGVGVDDFILLVYHNGESKVIDGVILSEQLDYKGLSMAWYSIQKQLDQKAVLERGGAMIDVVKDYQDLAWYLEFPVPTTSLHYTWNKRQYDIKPIIGNHVPLLTSLMKLQLGSIMKSGTLTLDGQNTNTLSFNEIMLNLHRIVVENHEQLEGSGFSSIPEVVLAQAIFLQEHFGIQVNNLNEEGIVADNLKIRRLVPKHGYNEEGNPIGQSWVYKEFTLDMHQFWENIENTQEEYIIAEILSGQLNEVTAVRYANIAHLLIMNYLWHDDLLWS